MNRRLSGRGLTFGWRAKQCVLGVGALATIWLMAVPSTLANDLVNDDLAADGLAEQTQQVCEFLPESRLLNTQRLAEEDVIVIGNQLDRRYRVAVRSNNPDNLVAIRACVPDAFLTRNRLGSHIQVGSFVRRSEAEALHRILRQQGYRSRVTYIR